MTRRTLTIPDKQRIYNEVVAELKKQPQNTFHGSVKDLLERIQARKGTRKPFKHMDMMSLRVRHLAHQEAISLHRQNKSNFGKVLRIQLLDESKAIVRTRASNTAANQPHTANPDETPVKPAHKQKHPTASQVNKRSTTAQRRLRVLQTIVNMMSQRKQADEDLTIQNALDINTQLKKDGNPVADSTLRDDLYFLKELGLIRIKRRNDSSRRHRKVSLGKDQTLESISGFLADDVTLDNSALKKEAPATQSESTPPPPNSPTRIYPRARSRRFCE